MGAEQELANSSEKVFQNNFSSLMLSLRARCIESARKDGLFRDPLALSVMRSIDYKFSDIELSWANQLGIAVRTYVIDEQVRNALEACPGMSVVNLGCGLDTRFSRVAHTAPWYDLDLPEVIALRRKFLGNSCGQFIEGSLNDYTWMDALPRYGRYMFIAEGVLAYLSQEQVVKLLGVMQKRFPESELVFTAVSPFMLGKANDHQHSKRSRIVMQWGIPEGKLLERWVEGLRFIKEWYYIDVCPARWKWKMIFRFFPMFRKAMKVIKVKFGDRSD